MNSKKSIIAKQFNLLLLLIVLIGCNNNPINNNSEPDIRSASIQIVSGNDQVGTGGEELSEPIVIKITDRVGKAVSNIDINCEIVEGNGSIISQNPISSNKNGKVELIWKIGESYNAIKISLERDDINYSSIYVYATGDSPTGVANYKSVNSLKKHSDTFYSMSFYGDYSDIVEQVNTYFVGYDPSLSFLEYHCSLFSVFGNSSEFLFGRSFDNPSGWQCLTLLGEYFPTDGYKSIAFSRMQDYGFNVGTELLDLEFADKLRLFESAGHVPDGINEHGVVAGLANVRPLDYTPDNSKETIWVTVLVRKILDKAKNVDEAIEIAMNHNIACPDNNTLGIHVLVADKTGKSVILEMGNGSIQAIPRIQDWQVITNSPSYNVSIENQKSNCNRFNYIYNYLEGRNGNITDSQGFNVLNSVGYSSTEWSAMYNMTEPSVKVAIDFDFDNIFNSTLVQ